MGSEIGLIRLKRSSHRSQPSVRAGPGRPLASRRVSACWRAQGGKEEKTLAALRQGRLVSPPPSVRLCGGRVAPRVGLAERPCGHPSPARNLGSEASRSASKEEARRESSCLGPSRRRTVIRPETPLWAANKDATAMGEEAVDPWGEGEPRANGRVLPSAPQGERSDLRRKTRPHAKACSEHPRQPAL